MSYFFVDFVSPQKLSRATNGVFKTLRFTKQYIFEIAKTGNIEWDYLNNERHQLRKEINRLNFKGTASDPKQWTVCFKWKTFHYVIDVVRHWNDRCALLLVTEYPKYTTDWLTGVENNPSLCSSIFTMYYMYINFPII